MKEKLRRRILRNLKRAKESLDLLVENLEDSSEETGFGYILADSGAIMGDVQIVIDLVKDELREVRV